MASFASKRLFAPLAAVAALTVSSLLSADAGLVAKWDFDNYDPENPTSAAILAPTVGSLAAVPCTGTTTSTAVTDGTLGDITVLAPSETGLSAGDYALAIPKNAHLKLPLPSGIVRDKNWMVRIRFCSPAASAGKLRALVGGDPDNASTWIWSVSTGNLIWGAETYFGNESKENALSPANNGGRVVTADTWNSLAAYFAPGACSTTLNGVRSVGQMSVNDFRNAFFLDDSILLCAGSSSELTYVASVEVWEDLPVYHDASGGAFLPATSRTVFSGCSLNAIRDMYIVAKGSGTWGTKGKVFSSWEHVVTSDGNGNATDLKVDLCTESEDKHVLCDFTNSGNDVAGNTLRMQHSLAWPNHYFTDTGAFVSSANQQAAGTADNYGGYCAWSIYAFPFRPLNISLNWSMLMGYGKFGNPVFTVVGDNPTLTFDVAPQVDSLTFDCGRGDGKASIRFAYASDALKTMSSLGDIKVRENVTLTVPAGVSITGSLALDRKAAIAVDPGTTVLANRDVVFTAAEGITLPAGTAVGDVATIAGGTLELSADGTQLVFLGDSAVPVTATWTGLGDRADILDPLNWECRNVNGIVLGGLIPTQDTAITISGETSFNLPANQVSRLQYRSLELGTSLTLTADCDWRGFGTAIPYSAKPTIDLQGHKLYVYDWATAANVTDSSSGDPGEYHLEIASKTTISALNMTGNVRFVKEGAPELVLNYAVNPTYTGGTEIREGRIGSTLDATKKAQFGKSGSEIIVRSGATLYPYNHDNWLTMYPIVLDGGSIYTWWKGTSGLVIGSMRLLADSSLDVYSGGLLHVWTGHTVNLNGHTLALVGAGDKCFSASGSSGVTFTEGVVDLQAGTMSLAGAVNAMNTTFLVGGALNLGGNTLNASNYVARYTGTSNAGTGALNVYGTFKDESGKFYGCTMQNGSTIDLSGRSDAQPATSAFTSGKNKIGFADGAAVTLYLGAREVAVGDKLIAWDADFGALTATFEMEFVDGTDTAEQRELGLELRADGVYVKSTAIPDYATWDVEETRWRFYRKDIDMEWAGGVNGHIQVRFSTAAEYAGLLTNNVTPSAYVLTTNHFTNASGTTVDLVDGIRFLFNAGTVFDVNGGTLKMPASLTDDGAKAFTVTSSAEGGVFELDVPENLVMNITGITLTGSLRFVKEGAGQLVLNYATVPTYTGGTEIREGHLAVTQNQVNKHLFGEGGSEIVVKSGGTLYPYNQETWLSVYKIVLDGGRMYTWWADTANGVIFGNLELLSDSTMATASTGGRFTLWQNTAATLNGHNLYLSGTGEMIFGNGVRIYGGTISNDTGTARFNGTVYATNTTFDISGKLNMAGTLNASNYVARYTGSSNAGTGALNVYGTFKPVGAGFYGPTMQDGSTVDLSEWKTGDAATSRFPLESSYANKKTMSFAAGATVTIDLSGIPAADVRTLATNETYLTKWTVKPDVAFRLDNATAARGYELSLDDDGLKLTPSRGFIIHIAGNKDVSVPREWVAEKCKTVDVGEYGSGTANAVETWLGGTGANGLPRWQSWLLGLDPANASSVVLCVPGQVNTEEGEFAIGANIDVQAGSGAAVTAYLDTSSDGKAWNEKVAEQALSKGGTVSFSRTLASGERGFYRIRLAVQ